LICIHDSQRRKKTLSPSEQLRMISDVCQHEGVQQCHLIGWCTGPKMAIRYCATFPSQVASLVLLNGSYKTTNSPADLDSSYECALKSLCELVDRKPEMAGLVRNQIRRRSMEDVQVDFSAAGEAAQVDFDLLTAVNVNLRDAILAPFESDASFIDYARQMIDFWQYDPRDDAVAVEPPVLLLASEHDKVATAAMSREAADFLSRSRLVEARGATHYCLYDRAPWLASVLDDFFNEVESDWRQLNRKQAGLTALL
jgi:pimeloyl-ACP methyl ester carboxylesterase